MAYEDVLKKYSKTSPTSESSESIPTNQPKFKVTEIDSLKENPYKNLVENVKLQQRVNNYIKGTKADEEGIRKSMNPGAWQTVKDTVKAIPGSAVDMTQFALQHPVKATRALGTGLLDFGPTAANTLQWLGRSVLQFVYGKENGPREVRLPKPSETLAEYLDYKRSPEEEALSEATTQYAGYAAGEGIFKAMGLSKTAINIGGDIVGGQLISESQNLKERGIQAVFDGLFGTAQMVGGKLFRGKGVKGEAKVNLEDGVVTEIKGGEPVPAPKEIDAKGKDVEGKPTGVETPKTAYVAKENLGVDARGKKIMATTEVDTKTGDAVVYYLKDLDSKPQLRQIVWDFEEPHILDKRLSKTGESFTPSLKNPSGNLSIMEAALGSFSKKMGQTTDEIAIQLRDGIQKVANNNKVITEQFADAFGIFKNKPEIVQKKAPILAKFFEHQLVEPRFSKKITTAAELETEMPNFKKIDSFETKVSQQPNVSPKEYLNKLKSKDQTIEQLIAENGSRPKIEEYKKLLKEGSVPPPVKFKKLTAVESAQYANKPEILQDGFHRAAAAYELGVEKIPIKKESVKYFEKKVKPKESKFAATSLETGKKVEGRSSFNPNTIDAPEDVEILFNKMDAKEGNFSKQRISKNNEDLKDLARMTGLTEDDLISLEPGSIANSETLVAARQLVLNKASEFANKVKGISMETASLAQKSEIRDSFLQLISMQKSVAGLRTEASNVLRSFGVKLRPGENIAIDELIANLKKLGIEDIDLNDANALSAMAGKVAKELDLTWKQKLGKGALQTWYASILSGPKTTVRNVLSTTANILSDMTSKVINPRQWKEVIPAMKGLVKGWTESAEKGGLKKIFTLDAVDPSTGKFFDTGLSETDKVFGGKFEKFGRFTEIPGRILNRQDARFRAAAEAMEKASLAVYTNKMTEATMKAVSESYGVSSVFRGTPKGRFVGAVTEASLVALRKAPEFRVIMPFVQTVANVLDRQFDYMPIFSALRLSKATIGRQVDNIARDFGITDELQKSLIATRLRDQQIGRMILGTAVTAGAIAMAKNGDLSGSGPTNYSERVQLQRTGWRPNSIKVGDTWLPYTYLGPLAGILALAGNVHDKVVYDDRPGKDIVNLIGYGLTGWMNTQLDNSFLSGVANLIDAVGPAGNPKKYVTQLAANLTPVPQAYTQTLDITKGLLGYATGDENFRQQYETRGYISKVRKSLGLTGDIGIFDALNPRYDQFGQVMTSDLIWGVTPSDDKRDAMLVDNFLINNEIVVSMPVFNREYSTPDGGKKALSEAEYNSYVRKSGREIYKTLNDALPALENMPQDLAKKQVEKLVTDIRKRVRQELLY